MIFKKHEQIDQELECELLLAECKANTGNLKQFREYYAKNVVKKAEALGAELRGLAVARSEWRIYRKLWNDKLKEEEKDYVLKTHLNKAMTESSRSEGEGWVVKGILVN